MEVTSIAIVFATCVSSFFGMNLVSGLEDHPFAFFIATPLILTVSFLIFAFYVRKFKEIRKSRTTLDYPVLKNIFRYLKSLVVTSGFCKQLLLCDVFLKYSRYINLLFDYFDQHIWSQSDHIISSSYNLILKQQTTLP